MALITSPFGYRSRALDVVDGVDLGGRHALVTGATSGLGVETARALAAAGATVHLPVRDLSRGQAVVDELTRDLPTARFIVGEMDLGSIASVRAYAATVADPLDILVANAGIMATPAGRTVDGFELQLGTNAIGHYALVTALLDNLRRASNGARVVLLSSIAHRLAGVDFDDPHFTTRPYDPWVSYGQSKSACSLLGVALTAHYADEGLFANAVHPGGIMTGLQKHMTDEEVRSRGWVDENGVANPLFKTPAEGASTATWVATSPALHDVGGRYFEDCQEAKPWDASSPMTGVMPHALDPDAAQRFWELCQAAVAL
jgi:NAD(P)-dependent dehydrogenase (short-subunit alcohol dehydrogenase family)